MPKYVEVKHSDDYNNPTLDEDHVNFIKTVIKYKDTLVNILENDKPLSNMLHDMIKSKNESRPNSPS